MLKWESMGNLKIKNNSMSNRKTLFFFSLIFFSYPLFPQNIIFQQDFDNSTSVCSLGLPYIGGTISSSTAYNGSNSLRIGNLGGSNNVLFSNIDVSTINNGILSFRHRVLSGAGPGMDTREGVAFLISLNGGPFTFISGISGFGDLNYGWNSNGGSTATSTGCNSYQTSNPFSYNIQPGTSTLSLKIISVKASTCATFNSNMINGVPSNFDRSDEGIYIDNVTISGTMTQPPIACYETATWNTAICNYELTGSQPVQPTPINCWDNYQFNTLSCSWVNQGNQPIQPTATNCWDNYQFNTSICSWVNQGTQPVQPTTTNCWDSYQFNTLSCSWVNQGTQPVQPTATNCWDNYQFNTSSCSWVNQGTQPVQPTATNCWDNYQFNTSSCSWVNTGIEPQITVSSSTICLGQSTTITAISNISGGSFLWNNSQTNSSITVSPIETTIYNVIYTINGCMVPGSGIVTVNAIPEVSFNSDQLIGCSPLTIHLESTGTQNGNFTWLINEQVLTGSTTQYTFSQGGCYDVTLTSLENGCSNSLTIEDYICVEDPPLAYFTMNPILLTDFSLPISFVNTSEGSVNYIWEFSDGQNSGVTNPILFFTNNNLGGVTATLTAISEFGCESIYSDFITFSKNNPEEESLEVYIPNTFTPDSDESNDEFLPIFSNPDLLVEFELNIFNRWGERLFSSLDFSVGWNGTFDGQGNQVQDGVYVYVVNCLLKNGINKNFIGHVSLIR